MSAPQLATVATEPRELENSHKFRWHLSDIARQSSISFAGTVFTIVLSYVFRIYLARELGARLLGWNALGMALYSVCKLLGETGLPAAALRYSGVYGVRDESRDLNIFFGRGLLCTTAGTCALGLVVLLSRNWLATRIFHDAELSRYLPLYAILIPVGAASGFLVQTLCGLRMVARGTFVTKFVSFPFMIVSTVVALALGLSLWGYVAAQIAGEFLTLALVGWTLFRSARIKVGWAHIAKQRLQPEARWYAVSMLGMGLLGFIGGHADRLILGFYLSAQQVGVYAIATSAVTLTTIVLQAVNSIFAPTIASLHAQGEHGLLLRLYQTLTKWILAFTLPVILIFLILPGTIMSLFGADFQSGWLILAIVTVGELVNCATGSVGYLLLMSGNQNWMIRVRLLLAALITLINIALIPRWGVIAAAAVSAAGTILSNVAYLVIVRRTLSLFPYNRSYLKLLAPTMGAAALVWFLRDQVASFWPASLTLAVTAALAGLVLLGGFVAFGLTDDDRLIVDIVKRRITAFV